MNVFYHINLENLCQTCNNDQEFTSEFLRLSNFHPKNTVKRQI